jgi:hypothetical protein
MAVDFWVNHFILEFEKYFTQHFILFLFQGSRAEIVVKAGTVECVIGQIAG